MKKGELKQRVQKTVEKKKNVMSALVDGVTSVLINEIYRPDHEWNVGNPEVINCLNGELHHESGKWVIKPHDREAFRTSQVPIKYNPQATAPKFKNFLEEIFIKDTDAPEKIKAVLEMVGYSMMAHCRHERFIILIGSGANGKSVLLSILEETLGSENVVGVQPSQFDNKFQRAHLQHKLANVVTEIRQGEVIADAELKGIVSGEPSTVENKFKDPFTMRPYATCWFATNHMPHTRDFSEALFRRALIIKFSRVFSSAEQNPKLKDDLLGELPGILNMALDAYAEGVKNGFTNPPSSEAAKEEWRLEADQVQQFVKELCVERKYDDAMVKCQRLYNAYRDWADDVGIGKKVTLKNFRDRLTRLGFGFKKKNDGNYVTKIELKTTTM